MKLEMEELEKVKSHMDRLVQNGIPHVSLNVNFPRLQKLCSVKAKHDISQKFGISKNTGLQYKRLVETVLDKSSKHDWTEVINESGGPETLLDLKILVNQKAHRSEEIVSKSLRCSYKNI